MINFTFTTKLFKFTVQQEIKKTHCVSAWKIECNTVETWKLSWEQHVLGTVDTFCEQHGYVTKPLTCPWKYKWHKRDEKEHFPIRMGWLLWQSNKSEWCVLVILEKVLKITLWKHKCLKKHHFIDVKKSKFSLNASCLFLTWQLHIVELYNLKLCSAYLNTIFKNCICVWQSISCIKAV